MTIILPDDTLVVPVCFFLIFVLLFSTFNSAKYAVIVFTAVPLALSGGQSGSEIQTPMAIVILCGLATSTLLNMLVVPTLYLKFGGAST